MNLNRMTEIKRIAAAALVLLPLLAANTFSLAFLPEEGMYAPDKIASLPLKKKGLKIPSSELYDPGKPSISDAIVRVNIPTGGFGTGEFVSANGLVLTNHHVAFDGLVEASTKEKDFAANGYSAAAIGDELPLPGYNLILTEKVEDVTGAVTEGLESDTLDGLAEARDRRINAIKADAQRKAPESSVSVAPLNDGLFYYLYQTKVIKDVRLVYAPPKNIGFFGGDPDNFEWTRHTGDFTFLRAYASPSGEFAEYSPDNVPFRPEKHLTISLGGLEDEDFVMVMGYPGGTTRFRESATVEYSQSVSFPFIADYVTAWRDALELIAEAEPDKAQHLQAQIFNLNNTIKVYEGNIAAMKRAGIIEKRRATEKKLQEWILNSPEKEARFGDVVALVDEVTDNYYRNSARDRVLNIFPSSSTTQALSMLFEAVTEISGKDRPATSGEEWEEREKRIESVFEGFEPTLEEHMIRFFLEKIDKLPQDQRFDVADDVFAGLTDQERREAEKEFAAKVVEKFGNPESIAAVYESELEEFKDENRDIVTLLLGLSQIEEKMVADAAKFNSGIAPLRVRYLKALSEFRDAAVYPDANATLRFSYGNVRGYRPKEAVVYEPFTTLAGVLEKDTGMEPFDVPEKLKKLAEEKAFGKYADRRGALPVNFLSSTDIIGGNSGSPVLNGYGEQVGIVFDGNYEGLGNNMFFSDEFGRTISVDIRYVLFLTERFGDSGWILNELTFSKRKAGKAASASS